jgi:hypothetical protein
MWTSCFHHRQYPTPENMELPCLPAHNHDLAKVGLSNSSATRLSDLIDVFVGLANLLTEYKGKRCPCDDLPRRCLLKQIVYAAILCSGPWKYLIHCLLPRLVGPNIARPTNIHMHLILFLQALTPSQQP